jgi:transcriptional regulator with XRE-family HTH domain
MSMERDTVPVINENLRYLLWSKRLDRREWTECLAQWIGCDSQRAEALLTGAEPEPNERRQLASTVGISEDTLQCTRLIRRDKIDVLATNLRYILDRLGHGERKVLAHKLNVHPTTISRWCSGTLSPSYRNLRALNAYLGLPSSMSLEREPIFLSRAPMSDWERRQSLHKLIDAIDAVLLRHLYTTIMEFYAPRHLRLH